MGGNISELYGKSTLIERSFKTSARSDNNSLRENFRMPLRWRGVYIWRTQEITGWPPILFFLFNCQVFSLKARHSHQRGTPAIVWAPWVTWYISGGRRRRRHCHSICAPTIESDAFIYLFFLFLFSETISFVCCFSIPILKKQKNHQNVHRSRKGVLGWLFCLFIYFFVVFFIPCEREKIHQVQQTRERERANC